MIFQIKNKDLKFMSLAINLAKNNIGITSPNPSVGTVIVRGGVILATGVTACTGRPHSEELAISKLSSDLLPDSVIYISLEPCCHQGGGGMSCLDLIIKSGIKRVVFAVKDPDTRTNGKSIKLLQEKGIEVQFGLMADEAKEVNRGFFKAKLKNKPFITVKIATTIDGKIATKTFDSKWITSKDSRQYTNFLRSKNDAILIGANSFKKDLPSLDCRISGLEDRSPKRIILNKNFDLHLSQEFLNSCQKIPTFFVVRDDFDKNTKNYQHINFIKCPLDTRNNIDLEELASRITVLGINNLLIEGGGQIFASFLRGSLIDELILVKGNFILGNDAISATSDLGVNLISDVENKFRLDKVRNIGDDIVIKYKLYQNLP
ncbi:MAG: diaminohydroxyphosphoribosylaminopyrimidine deaminase [Ulvibacter sp.]